MRMEIYKASNGLFFWQVIKPSMSASAMVAPVVAVSGHGFYSRAEAQAAWDAFVKWVRLPANA